MFPADRVPGTTYGEARTAEKESKIDPALEYDQARVRQLQEPVEKTEMKDFTNLSIGELNCLCAYIAVIVNIPA